MGRQVITADMFAYIFEVYDDFYAKVGNFANLKEVGEHLNEYFTEIYGEKYDFDESAYRKNYKAMNKGLQKGLERSASRREIERIGGLRVKLDHEKVINGEVKRQVSKIIRNNARIEYMFEEFFEGLNSYNYKDFKLTYSDNNKNEKHAIYIWTDFHYGVYLEVENGQRKTKNEYSPEIAKKRFNNFINYIIRDVKQNGYDKITVAGLGDDIEGILRPSAMLDVNKTITVQALECSDLYIQGIDLLLDQCGDLNVNLLFVNSSNHSEVRLYGAKRGEVPEEDMGLVIANNLIKAYRNNDRINITTNDQIVANILGKKIVLLHGHQHKMGEVFQKMDKKFKDVDYVIIGHYHSFKTEPIYTSKEYMQELITAPSLMGDTSYTNSIGFSSAPHALKLVVDKKYGILDRVLIPVK